MLNYNKINILYKSIDGTKVDFLKHLDITLSGFNKMMKQKSMKVDTLEKIAEYFNQSVTYFFDEEIKAGTIQEPTEVYGNEYKVKYLEVLEKYTNCLEEKDQLYKSSSTTKAPNKGVISKSQLK